MLYEYLKKHMIKHLSQVVEDEKEEITYEQLLQYAEDFGECLAEQKYGILCESDLNTAKALLSLFYAKKTAVLLSYKYGYKHNNKIIESIGLTHIITDEGIKEIENITSQPENSDDVALIMCTSGTTGAPKGAMITEENIVTNLKDITHYFDITTDDHILIARPLYHCAVLTGEFLISLIKGLHISFLSDGFVPVNILKCAKEKGVTVLCGTPTLFYHLSSINLRNKSPLILRIIAVSGECMTMPVAEKMRKAFQKSQIYNVYGLTEASPRVCYLPPEQFDHYPLSVGFPLASLETNIVDNELCIRGNSVMKGYYNNAEATVHTIKDGWLHTGDIAEMDNDGRITIKCRKDNMIIRSGMNIYPQEIENALKIDERIDDVLAFGIRDTTVGQKIHIQVVANLSKADIYVICKSKLPSFQLPDAIEIVSDIPKNASGKIVRPKG